jgi:copper/silver efflux system protein
MIRDEDGTLTDYIYIDLKNIHYGGFVSQANRLLDEKLSPHLPNDLCDERGLSLQWLLKCNFSVAVAVGYIALFGIAVETRAVMLSISIKAWNAAR